MRQILIFCLSFWTLQLTAQFALDSSFLPLVLIDTDNQQIVDDPRIVAQMGIVSNRAGQPNRPGDPFNEFEGRISIELRGSSSQSFPKKSYSLETQKEDGSNRNVSLLDMPRENDWILYGPFSDKSLMRNALLFTLARPLGHYAPRVRFCELFLNGEYQGVYLLMEKIKRDRNRVEVAELSDGDLSGIPLTGGYILKLDKTTGSENDLGWISQEGNYFQYDDPEEEELAPEQRTYLQQYIDSLEAALFSVRFTDPEAGYRRFVDVPSFVDFILMNELAKNVDGYRLSTFFHKDRGGKLRAGPLWDFNLGFGNANYCTGESPEGWMLNFNQYCPEDGWLVNNWWDRLLSDPYFQNHLQARWQELRQGPLHLNRVLAVVDSFEVLLQGAEARNFSRWPVLDQYVWPNAYVGGSHIAEVEYLRNWLRKRLSWMDADIAAISQVVQSNFPPGGLQVYPNPSQEQSNFTFYNIWEGEALLEIYDLAGKPVWTQKKMLAPGLSYTMSWDGRNAAGFLVSPGIFLYRLHVQGAEIRSGKLLRQ